MLSPLISRPPCRFVRALGPAAVSDAEEYSFELNSGCVVGVVVDS